MKLENLTQVHCTLIYLKTFIHTFIISYETNHYYVFLLLDSSNFIMFDLII